MEVPLLGHQQAHRADRWPFRASSNRSGAAPHDASPGRASRRQPVHRCRRRLCACRRHTRAPAGNTTCEGLEQFLSVPSGVVQDLGTLSLHCYTSRTLHERSHCAVAEMQMPENQQNGAANFFSTIANVVSQLCAVVLFFLLSDCTSFLRCCFGGFFELDYSICPSSSPRSSQDWLWECCGSCSSACGTASWGR